MTAEILKTEYSYFDQEEQVRIDQMSTDALRKIIRLQPDLAGRFLHELWRMSGHETVFNAVIVGLLTDDGNDNIFKLDPRLRIIKRADLIFETIYGDLIDQKNIDDDSDRNKKILEDMLKFYGDVYRITSAVLGYSQPEIETAVVYALEIVTAWLDKAPKNSDIIITGVTISDSP